MNEMKEMLHELADSTMEMASYTMDMHPNISLAECFPYMAARTIQLDGKDYQIHYEVTLKEIKWS